MTKQTVILARGIGAIGAVAALVTAVTFAALSTSVTLSDNTINTANAHLLVWDGDSFETTAPGFHVDNLVPSTPSTPAPFYLKNDGGVNLALTAQITLGGVATGVDPHNVHITIKDDSTGSPDVADTTLFALESGPVLFDTNLPAGSQGNSGVTGTQGNYTYSVLINSADVAPGGASVSSFVITIGGTQVGV